MRRTSRWVSSTLTASMADSGKALAATSATGMVSSAASSACSPPACTATVSTTGTPSSADSFAVSMTMPRFLATSTMFSASMTGRPRRLISRTRRRFRRRLTALTTQTMASGARSSWRRPATTSRVIASSGVVADRL